MAFRLISSHTHDVFHNLAVDHALFEFFYVSPTPIMIRIWKNESSVIVGRSQDIHAEVDFGICTQNNVAIARRISGGGAVYHDLGNLNLSFFLFLPALSSWMVKDINTARSFISSQITRILQDLGFDVTLGDRNSIFLQGKKVSGSGAYFRKNVLLHQMTLLLDVNLELLEEVLKARPKYATKRFPSVYSPTINLSGLSERTFISHLISHFQDLFEPHIEETELLGNEEKLSEYLERTLYRTGEWIMHADRSSLPPKLPFLGSVESNQF